MNNLILPLLLITSGFIFGQEGKVLNNFKIDDLGEVQYIKVFEVQNGIEFNTDILITFLRTKSNLSNINLIDGNILGDIENVRINYKKYGGKYMNTLIVLNHSMSGEFIIQLKENRYRLIIKDIKFLDDVSVYSTNSKKELDNLSYFSKVSTKNGGSKFKTGSIMTKGTGYMDKHFVEMFMYKKETLNDDW